jgi:hypothetical protein
MVKQDGGEMTNRQFVAGLARYLKQAAPDREGPPRVAQRFSMVQVSYGQPKLHYEAWIQRGRGQVELGLHFEASEALNSRLLQGFSGQMLAVRDELGPDVELEQWTRSWGRIHAYEPIDQVDQALVEHVGERMVALIDCLQPRLEAIMDDRVRS